MGKTFISEGKSSSNYLIYIHSPMEKNVFSAGYGDSYSPHDCGCSRVDPASCILPHCECLGQMVSCACLCASRGRPCSLHDYECSSQSEGLGLIPSLEFMLPCWSLIVAS